jgi:NitT/TauT family transport system substrate-binding protein
MTLGRRSFIASSLALASTATFGRLARAEPVALRLGHLNNLTHVQALVARALSDAGTPFLEPRLGNGVTITWSVYNAGTAVAEAMFARALDVAYIGPNPLLNGFIRSRGSEMRLLAGALRGGAALVVPVQSTLSNPADFRGKRIGTPALGNTQDVAARVWLMGGGLKITQTGGDASVLPTDNPNQLALFQTGQLDAVWTVEPWVSRLVRDGGGRILFEQTDAVTTLLAGTVRFVTEQAALTARLVAAHQELTAWIAADAGRAQALVVSQLSTLSGRAVSAELIADAWPRLKLDTAIDQQAMTALVNDATTAGFIRRAVDLSPLYVGAAP